MKKVILLLSFLFTISFSGSSQDLIVLSNGDSIPCSIKNSKGKQLHFIFKTQEGKIEESTLLKTQVKSYKYGASDFIIPNKKENISDKTEWFKYRISGGGGMTKMLGFHDELVTNLNMRYNAHGEVNAFFSKYFGAAAFYTFLMNKDIDLCNTEDPCKHSYTIDYVGLSLVNRLSSPDQKINLLTSFSLGRIGYTALRNSTAFGTSISIGVDVKIIKRLAVNLSFHLIQSALWTSHFTKKNLNRFDSSFGLSYYLWK